MLLWPNHLLEFIGFGDRMSVTWGQMLNSAQTTGALSSGCMSGKY